MAQPLYLIANVGVVAGTGMVAARAIIKDTVILEDDPLVVIDTNITHVQWNQGQRSATFYADERNNTTRRIHSALRSVRWRDNRVAFRALSSGRVALNNAPARVTDANIVESNAFGFEDPSQNDRHWLVVYRNISRLNHSCVPNARVTDILTGTNANRNPNHTGRMKIIATKDIALGEEITIEYSKDPGFWLHSFNIRSPALQTHWNFVCNCIACTVGNRAFTDSAWAFARALETEIFLPDPVNQPFVFAQRIYSAEQFISTLEFYGFSDERLSRALIQCLCLVFLKLLTVKQVPSTGRSLQAGRRDGKDAQGGYRWAYHRRT